MELFPTSEWRYKNIIDFHNRPTERTNFHLHFHPTPLSTPAIFNWKKEFRQRRFTFVFTSILLFLARLRKACTPSSHSPPPPCFISIQRLNFQMKTLLGKVNYVENKKFIFDWRSMHSLELSWWWSKNT